MQDPDLVNVTLVAGPDIDWYKAIRACRADGTIIDTVEVVNNVNSDSMILKLANLDELTLRKAGFAGIRNNKYVLTNSDIDHLGGYELTFRWQQD